MTDSTARTDPHDGNTYCIREGVPIASDFIPIADIQGGHEREISRELWESWAPVRREPLEKIKPDYNLVWVRGSEYISQEGTSFWARLRVERGWSRDDVYELSDWILNPGTQSLFEGDWGPCMPSLEEIEALAVLYGRKPGELLDECYEEKGRELLASECA